MFTAWTWLSNQAQGGRYLCARGVVLDMSGRPSPGTDVLIRNPLHYLKPYSCPNPARALLIAHVYTVPRHSHVPVHVPSPGTSPASGPHPLTLVLSQPTPPRAGVMELHSTIQMIGRAASAAARRRAPGSTQAAGAGEAEAAAAERALDTHVQATLRKLDAAGATSSPLAVLEAQVRESKRKGFLIRTSVHGEGGFLVSSCFKIRSDNHYYLEKFHLGSAQGTGTRAG
ncbi:hypothetical protein T492DRAFT_959865 [Pavlovales sp. CCMP2436]|nr:hypothetical protein T492DRAFT_959865 [Pavlovales sp. CCMP2436]